MIKDVGMEKIRRQFSKDRNEDKNTRIHNIRQASDNDSFRKKHKHYWKPPLPDARRWIKVSELEEGER